MTRRLNTESYLLGIPPPQAVPFSGTSPAHIDPGQEWGAGGWRETQHVLTTKTENIFPDLGRDAKLGFGRNEAVLLEVLFLKNKKTKHSYQVGAMDT